MRHTTSVSAVAALAVAAIALGCGNEARPGANAQDGSGPTAQDDSAAIRAVAPQLPELLSPFRKPKTAADEIPGDEVQAVTDLGAAAQPGESPNLSRRLELANGEYVYLYPVANGVCKSWDAGTGCTPTRVLADRGVVVAFTATRDSPTDETPEVSVFALARDGIDEVQLILADGRTLTERIQENGALVGLTEVPVEARWRNPDGSLGSQIVAPPGT